MVHQPSPRWRKASQCVVFKVDGETNTDDLSPAQAAWSRPDIPLHAKEMLVTKMPDGLATIDKLKEKGLPLAYVGDVVGTGSSRKSAINSVQWHHGQRHPAHPRQAYRRHRAGQQDRADLLQHRRGFRRAADPVRRFRHEHAATSSPSIPIKGEVHRRGRQAHRQLHPGRRSRWPTKCAPAAASR